MKETIEPDSRQKNVDCQVQTEEMEEEKNFTMEEVIGDFDSQFRELDEDDFKKFIKTTEITPVQLEIQDKCLKLRNMLRETIEKFFKAQASEAPTILLATLEDKSKNI
jgi:hypothetical protein